MGRLQRIENKLERAINGAFAKAFRSEVQPVEIASAVRRAMDDGATSLTKGRTYVPTRYRVELSETDYERLHQYEQDLQDELVAAAEEHAESQRYQTKAGFAMSLARDGALETGVFRIITEEADAPSRTAGRAQRGAPREPDRYAEDQHPHRSDRPGRSESESADAAPSARAVDRGRTRERDRDDDWDPAGELSAPRASEQGGHRAGEQGGHRASEQGGHRAGRGSAYDQDDDPLAFQPTRPTAPPAQPAPHRPLTAADRPWLEIDGDRYPLLGPMTVLGRDVGCAIVVDDVNASRRHSEIRVTVDGPRLVATVKDLGSTNGTWVNGERIASQRLGSGDRLTIGQTTFVYRAGRR